jgi:hypothetical protein
MRPLLALALFGCPGDDPTPVDPGPAPFPYGDSVRIGTFNVQFLPSTFNTMPAGDDVSRAQRIADRISLADYDIIALNEVFDEDSREVFVNTLKAEYPYFVAYIGDDAVIVEDSGLMLFSRFPFEALPDATHKVDPDNLVAEAAGAVFEDVAFIEYDASMGSDDWSGKGAAFVRIRNPGTQQVYNVAFTHMQASYPEEEIELQENPPIVNGFPLYDLGYQQWLETFEVRKAQLDDVFRVVRDSVGAAFDDELALVIGDLNIDGDLRDPDLGEGVQGCCTPNLWEWKQLLEAPDGWSDLWATEQSDRDVGLTNHQHWPSRFAPETGARLDYLLGHFPEVTDRTLCVQQMSFAHNLRDGAPYRDYAFGLGGINTLSDHIGLNLDLNRRADFCSVRDPRTNPVLDTLTAGFSTFPGSVQWTRIDEPGTYAFAVPTAGVSYQVYAANDLSTPGLGWYNETVDVLLANERRLQGDRYVLPEPPYFVRVAADDRAWTGPTELMVHRATCADPADPCVLVPGKLEPGDMPASPVNLDDTLYYTVRPARLTSGAAYEVRLTADAIGEDVLKIEIVDTSTGTIIGGDSTSSADADDPGRRQLDAVARVSGGENLLVRVVRDHPLPTSFRLRFDASVTVLHGQLPGAPGSRPSRVFCVEETDSFGLDELFLTVIADGATVVNDVALGEFDNGRYRSLEDVLPTLIYQDQVVVRLRDEDGGLNGGDDILETTFGTLPAGSPTLSETRAVSCCDGEYLIDLNRSGYIPGL